MNLKKILSIVISAAMVFSTMSFNVFAEFPDDTPVEVSTFEELVAALKNDNANIIMTADITGTATEGGYNLAGIVLNAGDVLDGNGHKLTINGANTTWDCAVAMTGGTVKNLTIAGAMRGVFMPGANGDVIIDNCVFDDVIYTFNSDAGSKDYSVTIKNTTLNGWTSFSNVHKSVTFESCTFGEGNNYAFCRPYQPTTFTGCEFNAGYEIDAVRTEDNSLKFTDCTYAGEELSAETAAPMFCDGGIVVIDDKTVEFEEYVPPVAQIGNTTYASLQTAVDSANDGETITLLSDIEYNKDNAVVSAGGQWKDGLVYTGDKSFTIDLNGHTISDNGDLNDYLIYFKNEGEKDNTITLTNGTISAGPNVWAGICVGKETATGATTLNLDQGLVVKGDGSGRAGSENGLVKSRYNSVVNILDGATINIGSNVMYGITTGGYNDIKPQLNIYDGAVITSSNSTGIAVTGNGILNIKGGNITSAGSAVYTLTSGQAEVTISGGTITGAEWAVASAADMSSYPTAAPVVKINGGVIKGQIAALEWGTSTESEGAKLTVSGGTFEVDPSEYLADDFESVTVNGAYKVVPKTSNLVFDTNTNDDITVSEGHYKSENRETEGIKWCTYTFIVSGEFNSVAVETVKNEKALAQTKNPLANISGSAMFGVVATGVGSLDKINVTATNN